MKQFMSRLGKAMGLLLTIMGGVTTSVLLLIAILAHLSGGWLVLLTIPLLIGGLLPLGLGIAALYVSAKIAREAIRDRFYKMLRMDTGRISLLSFSRAAALEPAVARQYLDAWARECDATFDVTDEGDIYYVFERQPMGLPGGSAPFATPGSLLDRVIQRLDLI
jgi:hypothetical protein